MKKIFLLILPILIIAFFIHFSIVFASGTIVYTYPNTITFSNVSGCGTGNNYDIVISDVDYPTQGDGTVFDYDYSHSPSYFPKEIDLSGFGMTTGHIYYAMLLCDDTGYAQANISFVYNIAPTSTLTPTATPTPATNSITFNSPNTISYSNVSGCGTGNNYDIVISDVNYPNQGDNIVFDYDYSHNPSYFPKNVDLSGFGMISGHTYYAMLLCDDSGFAKADISFIY